MADTRKATTEAAIGQISNMLSLALLAVHSELRDAALELERADRPISDIAKSLARKADELDGKREAALSETEPFLRGMIDDLLAQDLAAWRQGFAAGLKAYAHWERGEELVGTCGTRLSDALARLAAGGYDEYRGDAISRLMLGENDG